jgi:hypothetical protein
MMIGKMIPATVRPNLIAAERLRPLNESFLELASYPLPLIGLGDREGQNFRFQEIDTLELNRRTIRIRTDWLDHEPEKTHQILTAPGHQQMGTLMPIGSEGGPVTLALAVNEVHQRWEARMMVIPLFNIGFGLSTRLIHRTMSERKLQITLQYNAAQRLAGEVAVGENLARFPLSCLNVAPCREMQALLC